MGVCLKQPSEVLGSTEQTLILVVIMWVRGGGISRVKGVCWGGLINIPKFTGQTTSKDKMLFSSWWPKAVDGLNQHLRGEAVLDVLGLLCGCENMRCAVGGWGRLGHNHSVSSLPRSRGCRPLGSLGPLPCHWLTHRSLRGWKRMWVGTEWSSDNTQGQA